MYEKVPKEMERYGSSAGHYQEKLGPPVAEGILKTLGVEEGMIDGKFLTGEGKRIARKLYLQDVPETGSR
jgi:hypothetical protein